MDKIISFTTACKLSRKFKQEGKKVIFTSGCFDILHIGHVRFLQMAKKWGGRNAVLLVGVEPDDFLKINKGPGRPIFSQLARAEILASLSAVDYIVVLRGAAPAASSDLFVRRYRRLLPHVVVFGNTQRNILKTIKQDAKVAGCEFKHLPHKTKLESSSRVVKLILG